MLGRQERLLHAFTRAEAWLSDNIAETDEIARPVATFVAQLARARDAATQQMAGKRMHAAATAELREAIRRLRLHHLRPIVETARYAASQTDLAGLHAATVLPRYRMPVPMLLANARAMRQVAEAHRPWFVKCGRPRDFLAQLDAAITEIEALVTRRNEAKLRQVGATAALAAHLSYARRYLDVIDALLAVRLEGDGRALTEWRGMRRVRQRPGPKRH